MALGHELAGDRVGGGTGLRRAGVPAGGGAEGAALADSFRRDRQLPPAAALLVVPAAACCCRRWRCCSALLLLVGAAAALAGAGGDRCCWRCLPPRWRSICRRGRAHIDCGCGQSFLRQTLSWTLVARNVRAGGAVVAVAGDRRPVTMSAALRAPARAWPSSCSICCSTSSPRCPAPVRAAIALPEEDASMLTVLIVSQILSWIVILGLGLALLALARQVGVLHVRLAPAGALLTRQRAGGGRSGAGAGCRDHRRRRRWPSASRWPRAASSCCCSCRRIARCART